MYVIEQPIPLALAADFVANVLAEWNAVYDAYNEVTCLMLRSMTPELHRQFESYSPYEMLKELKFMFEKQAGVERFDLIQTFHGLANEIRDLSVGLIMNGLTSNFASFVRNYNKHNMGKMIGELHALLIEYENGKGKGKGKGKDKSYIPKPKKPKPSAKKHPTKDDVCHHCKEVGHYYALETATRILKMVPTKKVDKTPYELWYAEFFEKSLITQEVSGRAIDLEEIQDEDTSPSEITSKIPMEVEGFEPPQEEVILIRRSERTHRAPNRLCLNVEAEEHSLGDLNEPTSYKAAMLDPKSNKWLGVMNAEMQSMIDNMVWVLVDLPPNCKTVGSKWIFKKKTDMDGIVHTYKARLVAKGYTQLYGVDYEETFSPVADIRAIRILISIAAYYDYEIWQMDVKTAFLNGYLDEDIYMVQPEGFIDPNHPRKVCKLKRSIYGLKQASRSWNKRFDEEIKRFGFAQNLDEPCVYQKASGSNVTFLILYVDDIIIMGNHIPSLQSVKDYLGRCFSMKDLGEAAFILGIKIYRDRSKRLIGLSQNAYMDKILKRYKMDNSKRGYIPMQERLDLNKSQGAQTPKEVNRMKNVPYASAVGSIMYAVRCTRPDVAFAQNITSRFQQNPGELHWTAVKNILKYLRNTKDMFLVYGGNPSTELRVECYCDAGFETDRDDTKSQTGYVFVLNGGAVDWKSSKQSTIAMSATESEYIAASEAAMEAVWIRKFISGLGIVPTINEPINMYCDNSAAVHYANEPGVQRGARHYLRKYHYVRESVALGEIKILKVHTDNNLADPFTKALSNRKLTQHARSMGLHPASSFM
ncbi:retrotransposon protein, putative, ty1-copia subclass [Tanacetum coccineum]